MEAQNTNNQKVYIKTFGCQMNEFDSERILYFLEREGYRRTFDMEKANVIVFNTCAVREKAKNRLYGHVGDLKRLKEKNPDLLILVGGCTAQNLRQKLIRDFPYIDIIFGTHNISEIPKLIRARKLNNNCICAVRDDGFDYNLNQSKRTFKFKAYVPISIGCNNFCSYCIVPYVRGREVSIPFEEIIQYVHHLVSDGVIEVTLLGQNVNSYGKDLPEPILFSKLLEEVSNIKKLERIRFATSHPKDFSEDIVDIIAEKENIVNHIHLPLQAGSDKILKLMNRNYTAEQYLRKINYIREKIPDCAITTDIIVGFPGEEREDFLKTLEMIKKIRFNRAFTFIYSPRAGTRASNMPDYISRREKEAWFNELVSVQNEISYEENKKMVGKKLKVLVEGKSTKNNKMLEGRLESNTIVNFKGESELVGKLVWVEVTEAKSFYLLGRLCS